MTPGNKATCTQKEMGNPISFALAPLATAMAFMKQHQKFLLSHLVNHPTVKFPPVTGEVAEVRLVGLLRLYGTNGGIFGHGADVFHSLWLFLFFLFLLASHLHRLLATGAAAS